MASITHALLISDYQAPTEVIFSFSLQISKINWKSHFSASYPNNLHQR